MMSVDCASGPHHGENCLSRSSDLWISHAGNEAARLPEHGARRARQQSAGLLCAGQHTLRRNELAKTPSRWVLITRIIRDFFGIAFWIHPYLEMKHQTFRIHLSCTILRPKPYPVKKKLFQKIFLSLKCLVAFFFFSVWPYTKYTEHTEHTEHIE